MLTYLAILFATLLLLSIFGRKAYLLGNIKAVKKVVDTKEKMVEKEVSKSDKVRSNSLCARAIELMGKGKEQEAIKTFVQALALNENHMETNHKLAILYLKKQMYGSASALFQRLCLLNEDAMHYSHLGLALYHQSLLQEAKKAYQRSVELDPEKAKRFISLAQVYRRLGEIQNSIITVNKALALECKNLDFMYLLADLYLEGENVEEGQAMMVKIGEIDPDSKVAKKMVKAFKELGQVKKG
ncbi:tetratricopeptide repeat protein [Candidatus Gracilibacteria bacterium]|nr:tetratricopeptide repeat protein [Candidatus Gracilibacteria bacterium]